MNQNSTNQEIEPATKQSKDLSYEVWSERSIDAEIDK